MWTWIIGLFAIALISGAANKASPTFGPLVTGALIYFGLPALFLLYIWNNY
jgi:hypothetical protein